MAGPSNAGKTLGALMIAKGLGGKVALIDTERGSASLYSESFDFDTLELNPPYSPERFIDAIHAAEQAGYDVIIIDSSTHEWDGTGGCLEINEALAQAKYRGNTWSAWSETTPRHRAFLDCILQSPAHVIVTMRSKTETVQGEDKKVRKVGMKVEQRAGFEYEVTLVFEMEHSTHFAVMTKGRLFDAPLEIRRHFENPHLLTERDGQMLLKWLDSGAVIAPTAEELAAKKRDELSVKFAKALHPTTEEGATEEAVQAAIAASVYAVHADICKLGEEEYRAIWNGIPSDSRKALKHYIDEAKAKPVVMANGRAA